MLTMIHLPRDGMSGEEEDLWPMSRVRKIEVGQRMTGLSEGQTFVARL
jgi:hypothetical protein